MRSENLHVLTLQRRWEEARRRLHGDDGRVAIDQECRFVALGGTDATVSVWDLIQVVSPSFTTESGKSKFKAENGPGTVQGRTLLTSRSDSP